MQKHDWSVRYRMAMKIVTKLVPILVLVAGFMDFNGAAVAAGQVGNEPVNTELASTELASTERASTERASTERASTERASTERPSTEQFGSEQVAPEALAAEKMGPEQAGDDNYKRMLSGEVIIQTLDKDLSGGSARVEALFYSDIEVIWEVIGHCNYEFVYLKGLQECEVLQPGETHMLLRHRMRNSWYTPTLDFTFSATRTKDGKGEASLVSGNLKVLQGAWEMRAVDAGRATVVSHEVRIQPSFPVPRWLIRRSLNNDLPDMLACIRGLAHASGEWAQEQSDLQRCPGDVDSLAK